MIESSPLPEYRWLFLLQAAPYADPLAIAGLDALMAAGAFGQSATALFTGAGGEQFSHELVPDEGQRSIIKTIRSLPLYYIEVVYLDSELLPNEAPEVPDLVIHRIDKDDMARLVSSAYHVVSF